MDDGFVFKCLNISQEELDIYDARKEPFQIYTAEVEKLTRGVDMCIECVAIPKIFAEVGVRNVSLVVFVVRVVNCTNIYITCQYGTRNCCHNPVGSVE